MIITYIIFFIISLILVFIITNIKDKTINTKTITNYNLLLSILIYLVVSYFLADFYSFNPLEIDSVTGIKVNPYVSIVSLILQFLNTILLIDTCYKIIIERLNHKLSIFIITIIFNLTISISSYFLYYGYTGIEGKIIYSSLNFLNRLSIIMLYIPFILYDLNLLTIIKSKKK